jgi:hypothetical protein
MKRFLWWALGSVGALFGAAICIVIAGIAWVATAPLENGHKALAALMRTALPEKTDGPIVMVDVKADGKSLTFIHVVDTSRVSTKPDYWAGRSKSFLTKTCAEDSIQKMLSYGGNYRFVNQDARGVVLSTIELSEASCAGTTKGPVRG